MSDFAELKKTLAKFKAKQRAIKEAMTAVATAEEVVKTKSAESADVEKEVQEEFRKRGGVEITIEEEFRSRQGSSRVEMQLKKSTRSASGLRLVSCLASFDINSEVGKKMKRARGLSPQLFKYLVKHRVFLNELRLVSFGGHIFEKTEKGWRKVN
ncbi:hypothetical protein HQ571_03835 [Candidatus Kuenenbacteria bacterium]|nr:hypothetical protein [Candidatus Kuenenbacteria bacterium]